MSSSHGRIARGALSRPTWDIADIAVADIVDIADIAAGWLIAGALSRPTWDIGDIAAGWLIAGALSRRTWDIADGRGARRQPTAVPWLAVGAAWRHAARSAP